MQVVLVVFGFEFGFAFAAVVWAVIAFYRLLV